MTHRRPRADTGTGREQSGGEPGVRFRLFPQAPVEPAFAEPETVIIARVPGSIGPGPSDERMYVIDALDKSRPYESPYLPPFSGSSNAPVLPGPDGHFDHFEVGTREFNAAHMYGTIRLVLDIWEDYFGQHVDWHFAERFDRLELIPHLDWDNAHSGWGFIETGYGFDEDYGEHPFCLNFDILSHELGHSFVFALVGTPPIEGVSAEYLSFHEAAADIVTLVSTLHFRSVIDYVLGQTRGNIYVHNELNRFAELSPTHQVRSASNLLRMDDVPDVRTPVGRLSQPDIHLISQPLTGAVFDILVDLYQTILLQRGLITGELDERSRRADHGGVDDAEEALVQRLFDEAFRDRGDEFALALIEARDIAGSLCANAFMQMRPDLSYPKVYEAFLRADRDLTNGQYRDVICESFDWRSVFLPAQEAKRQAGRSFARRSIVTRKSKWAI